MSGRPGALALLPFAHRMAASRHQRTKEMDGSMALHVRFPRGTAERNGKEILCAAVGCFGERVSTVLTYLQIKKVLYTNGRVEELYEHLFIVETWARIIVPFNEQYCQCAGRRTE